MHTTRFWQLAAVASLAILSGGARPADDLDAFVETQMARREIVGLSLAIIKDGQIVSARAYGATTRGGSTKVTLGTLFQAGSISKPVAAMGAMKLVQAGKLSLDEDVNAKLTSWKVPDNDFTKTERVTPRRLLSHTAGLTVHGFPGYAVTEHVPSVPDVLDGKGNTPAVRVDVVPGTIWRYSGGGYTVMQQLVIDVTGKPFPDYMRDNVLRPLGMTSSTYEQPLPPELAARTATGYYADRSEVEGKWHVYPEMAAAGLWTTPMDLARYAIGVQQALAGKSKVLSAETTRQMLTVEKGNYGLGPGVQGSGRTLRFSHGGRDEGFDAFVVAYAETGDGLAIMINANDNSRMANRIINFIAKKYNWPEYPLPTPKAIAVAAIPLDVLAAGQGHFEFMNNNIMTLVAQNGRLFSETDGLPDEEFVPDSNDHFVSAERGVSFRVLKNAAGEVDGIEWTQNNTTRHTPRLVPLFSNLSPDDPDPAFTSNVMTVLKQFAEGGKSVTESALLTAGAQRDFAQAIPDMRNVRGLLFVHTQDLRGRGVERHGHAVVRIVQYRMETPDGTKLLLIHVDPTGLVTDYDLVSR